LEILSRIKLTHGNEVNLWSIAHKLTWLPWVSHGCIRIPMFAARGVSEIATIGMVVIVYDSNPLAEADAAEPDSVSVKDQSTGRK
jgi:hypothetical protein